MTKKNLTSLPDTVGTARLIGVLENNTPEWHAVRATGIGGSDIAAICKASPWTSPFALWAKKTGRIDDSFVPSEAAEWGTRLEAVVLDKFEESHPEFKLHRNVGTWHHVDREWQLANPDAIFENADGSFGIVEVKTSRYEDDWSQGVPAYYRTQVQWYLQTFGFKQAIVVALFAGSKYREFEVIADDFEQTLNLGEVENFRKYLDTDSQPDYDGALSTYETVRELHPDIDDTDIELGDLWADLAAAQLIYAQAEENLNRYKSTVLDAMGKSKRGTYNGDVVVTRQARSGGKPYLVNKKG